MEQQAQECLYCIAKRIFLGTNDELISKTRISQRFQVFGAEASFQANSSFLVKRGLNGDRKVVKMREQP